MQNKPVADEIANYEKLFLTKEDMYKIVDNATGLIQQAGELTKMRRAKILISVNTVKMLIALNDEETLNIIWNEVIKFTDYLRTRNALKSEKRLDILDKLLSNSSEYKKDVKK